MAEKEEKTYELKLNPDYYVVTANDLIKGRQKMSEREAQLLYIAMAQVVKEDKDFKTYTTTVPELAAFMGISPDSLYRDLKDICKSLLQRVVEIQVGGENADMDLGNAQYGGHEALVVFDNVFVPNERVFMCREYEFAGMMVERFAGYHRQSYGGCKVGVGDVLIGAAALAADYNGVPKANHIKDKLIEMIHLNETLYACGIACSAEGEKMPAGNYQINLLLANVCKQNITRMPYEIARLAEDIAGGLMVTMPSEQDLRSEKIGPYVEKYLQGATGTSTENRMRILRLIENITLGTAAVGYRTESMHGAGSPQAQRIMISRQGNLAAKKELAKVIAKVDESKDRK